ncbi:MAG TPA: hypothetical protein VNM43_05435 [Dehalococcoidia bacterium]|nr:hypothetical protein [Dehalococcoidia bacterium]
MRRMIGWLAGASVFVAAACGQSESTPGPATVVGLPTEPPRPAVVQADARFIAQPLVLGSIERQANASPTPRDTRLIAEFSCQDGVFLIRTDREDVWSLIPCDRVPPDRLEPYRQEPAVIKMDPLAGKLRIETLGGAQAEFTVEATWVYERPR